MTDEYFVEGAEEIKDSAEILNWYRNLYHTENSNTERGIMARAINELLPEYCRQKAEIDILIRKKEKLRDELAEQQAEIERLKKQEKTVAKMYYLKGVRDFAKRVKQEINFPLKVWKVFDNLSKEMESDL